MTHSLMLGLIAKRECHVAHPIHVRVEPHSSQYLGAVVGFVVPPCLHF